jgi:hypothetical protein
MEIIRMTMTTRMRMRKTMGMRRTRVRTRMRMTMRMSMGMIILQPPKTSPPLPPHGTTPPPDSSTLDPIGEVASKELPSQPGPPADPTIPRLTNRPTEEASSPRSPKKKQCKSLRSVFEASPKFRHFGELNFNPTLPGSFHSPGYVVPINQLTDDGAGRGCLKALGVLFRMAIETKLLEMEEQKVFFRMCQPNINVRWVSMIRLTETTSSKSLTSAILCDTSKYLAQVPNLDAQISVLPYQVTADGPSEIRAQLFSNMGFTFD